MHYWNKDNFEGLLDLAAALEQSNSEFALLSKYCRGRESGLRQKAFEDLNQFLDIAKSWPEKKSRAQCITILELQSLVSAAHQFLSQPLLSKFIEPVLEKWLSDQPNNVSALRWLGLLNGKFEYLSKALALSPDDNPVRAKLISLELDEIDFATHHLDENHLIGDLNEVLQSIDSATQLLSEAPRGFPAKRFEEEISQYASMLKDWKDYSATPVGTFPEWCAARARPYVWPTKIYYDKK